MATRYGCLSFCGVACPWQCGKEQSPFPEPNTAAIELNELIFAPAVKSQSQQEAATTFLDLRKHVTHLNYLPSKNTRFLQLLYYAHMSEKQSPYSESDRAVLKRSYKSDKTTKTWLRVAAFVAFCSPLAIWGLSLYQDNPIALAGLLAVTIGANMVSWIATGSNPDFKSDSANDRQDILLDFVKTMDQISLELIDLKAINPHLARQIAQNINLDLIREKMVLQDPRAREPFDLSALESACSFAVGGSSSERSSSYIDLYILVKKITSKQEEKKEQDLELGVLPTIIEEAC